MQQACDGDHEREMGAAIGFELPGTVGGCAGYASC